VTVAERRDAVHFLHGHGLSVQRACQLVGLHRSTYHYQARPDHNTDLLDRIQELAQRHPRYGYRRIWALLGREQTLNKKRVQRLWQQAQLQVRKHRRKRRRVGGGSVLLQATYPGHVWTYDFIYDACRNGTQLKILTVMDEFTREGLALEVATSLPSKRVIAVLARLFAAHGAPAYLRSDNGPEFIAQALRSWLAQHQTSTLYIDPGCPWQNAFGESFNGSLRDECLQMQLFESAAEARIVLETYRRHYNDERPHSSLGYQTPTEFKCAWLERQVSDQDSNMLT
jgi:putative transposase